MVVKNTPTEMFWVSDSTLYSELAESLLLESPSKLPFPKKMHAAKSTPALAPNRRMSESEITELPFRSPHPATWCAVRRWFARKYPRLPCVPGDRGNRPEAPGSSALVGRQAHLAVTMVRCD